MQEAKQDFKPDFRYIVRVLNTDLDGKKPIGQALRKIKGISFMFSNMICNLTDIDKTKQTGYLADSDIEKINEFLKDPAKFKVPSWMFNRQKDYEDGTDKHVFGTDLTYVQDNDIKRLKKIKAYTGMRHAFGLPVRGQRTRSNFRKNKGKGMGVKRKRIKSGRV